MKNFKAFYKIIVCFVLLVFTSNFTYGQNIPKDLKDKTPAERAKFQTDLMKSKLNLDSNQSTKVQSVNLKYAQKFETILKSNDSKMTRLKQAMELQKLKNEELRKIFSASQYKTYEKIEDELKAKVKSKM